MYVVPMRINLGAPLALFGSAFLEKQKRSWNSLKIPPKGAKYGSFPSFSYLIRCGRRPQGTYVESYSSYVHFYTCVMVYKNVLGHPLGGASGSLLARSWKCREYLTNLASFGSFSFIFVLLDNCGSADGGREALRLSLTHPIYISTHHSVQICPWAPAWWRQRLSFGSLLEMS